MAMGKVFRGPPPCSNTGMGKRWVVQSVWLAALGLCCLRFFYLHADFPNYSPWMLDQAKFTDEGWWASAAVNHVLLGHWNVPGDYNPGAALPVWALLLAGVFKFTGVSIVAARAVSVAISVGMLGVVFLLVRRYSGRESEVGASVAALLLAASPFAFAFSRLAILDTLVVFEFCLLLLVCSYAGERRAVSLALAAFLGIALVLTKTTAVLLLPAVFWLLWFRLKGGWKVRAGVVLLLGAGIAAAFKAHALLMARLGYSADYRFFYAVNEMPHMVWSQAWGTAVELAKNCRMIDPILYPLGIVLMVVATVWVRRLWANPLFAACWIAFGCQAVFIFSRQDDYAPRYFLAMIAPLVMGVGLAVDELRMSAERWKRGVGWAVVATIAVSVALNAIAITSFLRQRTYQLYDAATSIAGFVRGDARQNQMILGVSGSQLALMTGIPAISDAYGTEPLGVKIARYHPGWYVVWNEVAPDDRTTLSGFELEQMGRYPAFDDDERNVVVLYRLAPKAK
jgi:Dolichyl-phosphate-mannose-protein mannosyltransferase